METRKLEHIKKDIPAAEYDEAHKCFRCRDGSYFNIYRIVPRDLVNSDVDEIEMDCFKWTKFYKTYGLDIEIIPMMFPCNTGPQQKYWKKKLQENKNPLFHDMLRRKADELEYREKHAVTKEFFMMLFFEDLEVMESAVKTVDSTLQLIREKAQFGRGGMLEEIPEKKKIQVLFKLANKNLRIF